MSRFMQWLWPAMVDHKSAKRGLMQGYVAAGLLSVVFFFTAFLATYMVREAGGPNHRLDMVDAFAFMIVGWFIKGGSKGFAVTGTILCAFEAWQRFSLPLLPVFALLLLMFVNSIRGADALKRYPRPDETPAST